MSPGVVVLTSRTDLGSTLVNRTVKLLLPDSDGNHVLAAAKPALAPLLVLLGGSQTILLVEDEAAVRRATAEFLRLQGYNVIEARMDWTLSRWRKNRRRFIWWLAMSSCLGWRRGSGEGSRAAASGHAVPVRFRLRGNDDSRPQGGGFGNELPPEAVYAEATVVQDSQGAGQCTDWWTGRVTLTGTLGVFFAVGAPGETDAGASVAASV
jgi:hypothetical protein